MILRTSAWCDDGNTIRVEVVAWNETAGEKVVGCFACTPEAALAWAYKLQHAASSSQPLPAKE